MQENIALAIKNAVEKNQSDIIKDYQEFKRNKKT